MTEKVEPMCAYIKAKVPVGKDRNVRKEMRIAALKLAKSILEHREKFPSGEIKVTMAAIDSETEGVIPL